VLATQGEPLLCDLARHTGTSGAHKKLGERITLGMTRHPPTAGPRVVS
jgi:hypothetical protein